MHHNPANRLTTVTYPIGVATTFEYDGGSSPTPAEKGELTRMTDESGQTTYSDRGRMSSATNAGGTVSGASRSKHSPCVCRTDRL